MSAAQMETVRNGFEIILSDPHVKAVLVNIFGGIRRCDRVAKGIMELQNPSTIRKCRWWSLEGTTRR